MIRRSREALKPRGKGARCSRPTMAATDADLRRSFLALLSGAAELSR